MAKQYGSQLPPKAKTNWFKKINAYANTALRTGYKIYKGYQYINKYSPELLRSLDGVGGMAFNAINDVVQDRYDGDYVRAWMDQFATPLLNRIRNRVNN